MLKRLPAPIRGALSLVLYTLNTLFWTVPILVWAVLKFLVPAAMWRKCCDRVLNGLANRWVGTNTHIQDLFCGTRWVVSEMEPLPEKGWYLVLSNHQSWVDILVLQRLFHGRIPFLKFFLKKELFWVPVLGLAWWALDFPFMKRYSRAYLKKHPHRAGKDMEITRKACEKFRNTPISVMNFVEGTRFTPEKHALQRSPFKHLLKTHAGGIAYVLSAMGGQINRIVDVTIVYPKGVKRFWNFAKGDIEEIRVHMEAIAVTPDLVGDYMGNREFRSRFHQWLNDLWEKKDRCFDRLMTESRLVGDFPDTAMTPDPAVQLASNVDPAGFGDNRTPAAM